MRRLSATRRSDVRSSTGPGGDPGLRKEVEDLPISDEQTTYMIDQPVLEFAAELLAQHQPPPVPGRTVGPYKFIKQIGRGGMGKFILRATQDLTGQWQSRCCPIHLLMTLKACGVSTGSPGGFFAQSPEHRDDSRNGRIRTTTFHSI